MLVTAGPTLEDIDPVRFIGNRSTGKMGFAIAQRARARGAEVTLVAGPTHLPTPTGVERKNVRSAAEMQQAVEGRFAEVDVAILAAAVADYRVAHVADEKIKRGDGGRTIQLVENPDIAAELGAYKEGQTLVLFAMETDGGIERAREKLARKGGDLIALNNLRDEGAGFAVDTNVLTLIDRTGKEVQLPKMSKLDAADQILDWIRAERAVDV
jgi:phosphopantothenoylcysteine decarboxylase/phosphopantothenate--cysteine ligase